MTDKEIRKELEQVLRNIYDDDDFALGTVFCLETPENWETMLRFVAKAEELGDEVTHDDLLALSIVLEGKLHKQ